MRKTLVTLLTAVFAVTACDTLPTDTTTPDPDVRRAAASGPRTYQVTVTNLTEGQPFSPGVIATHRRGHPVFRRGARASEGLRLIAENGDPSTAVSELTAHPGVLSVDATTAPVGCIGCLGPFGTTLTMQVTTDANARFLSLGLMLICTNDGFVGLRVRLPRGYQERTRYARAYDAGTEANEETWDSIVDPCGGIGPFTGPQDGTNDRTATESRIRRHRGIRGGADLNAEHAWRGPVAKVTVKRIN